MRKGTTKSQGQKDSLDKFYTKAAIAKLCIEKIKDITAYDNIIEPSAGNGAFLDFLPSNTVAFDIEPAHDKVVQADWFSVDKKQFLGDTLIIGNPPFGVQSNLAIRFFNDGATFAKTIAFILPLSFKKNSIQNKLSLDFHLIDELIIPKNAFILNAVDYDIPTVFQIWERGIQKRKKIILPTKSSYFDYVDKEKADIRVPRVGGKTGIATLDLEAAATSNYFIKNKTELTNEDFVELINSIEFPSILWTVGPKSLSKGEMVYEIEKRLGKIANSTSKK